LKQQQQMMAFQAQAQAKRQNMTPSQMQTMHPAQRAMFQQQRPQPQNQAQVQARIVEPQRQTNQRMQMMQQAQIAEAQQQHAQAQAEAQEKSLKQYQPQLELLEQQCKKRCMMARQEQESKTPVNPMSPQPEQYKSRETQQASAIFTSPQNHALEDYQMELTLCEQQNKKRNMSCAPPDWKKLKQEEFRDRQPQPQFDYGGYPAAGHRLQDYQMQLILLEQQNKKRLMVPRQSQDAMPPGQSISQQTDPENHGYPPGAPKDQAQYQMQLMLLEAQNKKRLTMSRQDLWSQQDAGPSSSPFSDVATAGNAREPSVMSDSTWSPQFTPESTPGFPGWDLSTQALNDDFDAMLGSDIGSSHEAEEFSIKREDSADWQHIAVPMEVEAGSGEAEHDWISYGSRDVHSKRLPIRERPTCDD